MDRAELGNGLGAADCRQDATIFIGKWGTLFWQELLIDHLGAILALPHGNRCDARQGFPISAETMGGIADDEDPGIIWD